jgi:hypothetical protein
MPAGTKYYIRENMLSASLVNDDLDKDGVLDHYHFTIRNLLLHAAHPLAWYREIVLFIDGTKIEDDKLFLVLRKQWFNVRDIPSIREIFWLIAEKMEIFVKHDGGIRPGKHNVRLKLRVSNFEDTWFIDTIDAWGYQTHVLDQEMIAE